MRRLKKYIPFLRAHVMETFVYRGAIWLWVTVDIFQFMMMVFLWQSVFRYNETIGGFTFNQMIVYFLLTNIFYIFTDTNGVYQMAADIKEGRISLFLTKPISYHGRLLAKMIGEATGVLMLMLPIAAILIGAVTVIFDITWSLSALNIVLALCYVPLILWLVHEFNYIFGTLSIHTTNVFGISIFMYTLIRATSGQLLPLSFYPPFLFSIVDRMPFKFISYPPLLVLNLIPTQQALQGLLMLFIWACLFRVMSFSLFRVSEHKLVIHGG